MPRPDNGVPCKVGYVLDLRQAPNLAIGVRPVCLLARKERLDATPT
ncbi:hypothetical protein [Limnohabitans sp. Jir72]|nr:hypothetical protein [Limnohabitans sp. Jir72]